MSVRVFDFLAQKKIIPQTATIIADKKTATHAMRKSKTEDGIAISYDEFLAIPNILANPKAILWDKDKKNVLYAFDSADKNGKLVIEADYRGKGKNRIKTAGVVDIRNLKDKNIYEVIEGEL